MPTAWRLKCCILADGDSVRGRALVQGERRAPEAWKIRRLVFLKKPDAKTDKGLRGFRAITLLSVFSKLYATVLVDLLHEEKELVEWRMLHVGAERGVNCEHMQALERHWE